jgi:hypothetical protein
MPTVTFMRQAYGDERVAFLFSTDVVEAPEGDVLLGYITTEALVQLHEIFGDAIDETRIEVDQETTKHANDAKERTVVEPQLPRRQSKRKPVQ